MKVFAVVLATAVALCSAKMHPKAAKQTANDDGDDGQGRSNQLTNGQTSRSVTLFKIIFKPFCGSFIVQYRKKIIWKISGYLCRQSF